MDLTKYLRPSNRINSPSVETSKRREQYKCKNKIGAIASRKSRANQAAESRKENRANKFMSHRGIPTTPENENDTSSLGKNTDKVEKLAKRKNYRVATSEAKQKERLQKLEEFKEHKKQKKQKEKESKLPPFLTGIRGMRTCETDLYKSATGIHPSTSFALNRLTSNISHLKPNDIFVFTGKPDKKLVKNKTVENIPPSNSTCRRVTRSAKAQVSKTIPKNEPRTETKKSSPISEVPEQIQEVSMRTPPNPEKSIRIQSRCNTPWPANARRPTPEISESSEEEIEVKESIPNKPITNEKPLDYCEEEESRDIVTPLRPPKSMKKRCPASANNKVSVLGDKTNMLTPKHSEIVFERGSFSDRRRQRAGKSDRKSFIDELDFDEVLPNRKSNASPMSEALLLKSTLSCKKNKTPGEIEKGEEMVFADNASESKFQPKNLEDTEYNVNEVVEEIIDKVTSTGEASNIVDVAYFKSLLAKESEKLTSFCEKWNEKLIESFTADDLNEDLSPKDKTEKDEIEGQIRATIGKAQILMNRKGRFHQFQDLINNCEYNLGEKKTTCTDLQGFWEMIYFQVEECTKGFSELSEIEKNGWKTLKFVSNNIAIKNKKAAVKKITVNNDTKKISVKDRKPSSNIREMMAAKRREMALAKKKELSEEKELPKDTETHGHKTESPNIVSTTVSEPADDGKSSDSNEDKVFDGGFFSIQSPVSSRKNTPVSETKSRINRSSISSPSSKNNTPVQK